MSEDPTSPDVEEPIEALDTEGVEPEAQTDEDAPDEEAEDGQPEDDSEEVEYEGKKYTVPKEIRDALLRQADYTRKTQEVAETRKQIEAEQARVAQEVQAVSELREQIGTVQMLKSYVSQYEAFDWAALSQENPQQAQTLWFQYQQAKDQLGTAEKELSEKEAQRLQAQTEFRSKAMKEAEQVLARDIKGWSVETGRQIAEFAIREAGVAPDELGQMADPRVWKLLHRAMTAEQALAKQQKAQRQEKAQQVTPAKTVNAKSGGYKAGLDDSLPVDEWMRRRNAQLNRS